MKTRVLVMALLALLALSCNAWAYRLVVVPSGDLLATGWTRLEFSSARVTGQNAPGKDVDGWYSSYRLDSTVLPNLEVGVNISDPHGKPGPFNYVNGQYQILKAKGYRPNITIGAWDVGTPTKGNNGGRTAFVTAMEVLPAKGLVGPLRLHIGYGDQKLNGFFGGILVPMDKTTQFVVEYCPRNARLPGGKWYNFAIGHNFTPNWRVKAADLGGYLGLGIVYINHL